MTISASFKDIMYTEDGDFVLGKDNSLAIATHVNQNCLQQLIVKRLQSSNGDYDFNGPFVGCNFDNLFGRNINQSLLKTIELLITNTLTYDGLVSYEDLRILPLKINESEVFIALDIRNPNIEDKSLRIQVIYDTRNNKVTPRILNNFRGKVK